MINMKHFSKCMTRGFLLCGMSAMVLGSMPVSAWADGPDYTMSVIDTTKTGSLTLYKLTGNSGVTTPGTGLEGEAVPAGETAIPGVTFSFIKVGELAQLTEANVALNHLTSIPDDLKTLGQNIGVTLTTTTAGTQQVVTTDNFRAFIEAIKAVPATDDSASGEVLLNEWIAANGTEMTPTDDTGKTTVADLPLGLYLVAESDWQEAQPGEAAIVSPVSPFTVMLPMTNVTDIDGYAPGMLWQYDVTAYPKNNTVNLKKEIILNGNDGDGTELALTTDRNIGDEVTMLLTADVPKMADGRSTRLFALDDEMDEGLAFVEVETVTLGTGTWQATANTALTEADYEVTSADAQHFSVTLTEDGLDKVNALDAPAKLYVRYTTVLTKAAGIGPAMTANTASLRFGADRMKDVTVPGNTAEVATYEIDLTKTAALTDADLTQAVFELYRGDDLVSCVQDEAGRYHVADREDWEEGSSLTSNFMPDADGHLYIRGLDAATYTLTEINAPVGHSLLKAPVVIDMTAPDEVNGSLDSALVGFEGENGEAVADTTALADGIVPLTVENAVAIDLPHTGGRGLVMYGTAAGGVLLLALVLMKKRRHV
ncbi:MAG: SpaH/EbpB family LPXTG-anchored major pilin [Lachnospiraceae bacterium]|nr:SpaH/EbpB family LPXTG-anchored major pilin [Lachnospiraceae bacterium]